MSLCQRAIQLFVLASLWATAACALGEQSTGPLADYLQSPQGSAEWKSTEQQLAQAADAAATEYRRIKTLDALRPYETAVRACLDHGFLLYRVLDASSSDFPKGFRSSLEDRASELMDIADEYLKLGANDVIAVGIARDVIHKYNVERMDRAQRRAEGILMQYRYQRNY
jgi:hypothetical protein